MSDKIAVISRRVLRSVSMTDVKEQQITSSSAKDDNLQSRIEELEKFILSLNLDSALIEPLKIKQKVGSKRGRKKVEEKVASIEDELEIVDTEVVKTTKKNVRSSSKKGVAFKNSLSNATGATNNENNNDTSINQKTDLSAEEVISDEVNKANSVSGVVAKRSRTVRSKSPATISPLHVVSRSALSSNAAEKKNDSISVTTSVPFENPDNLETLNSLLDQPTEKQLRKMPNFLAARLNTKGPAAPTASVIAARKAAAASTSSAPPSISRIPSAPRQGRDLSTGRSKTEAVATVTFSASTKRPAPSVISHRSSSAERKSISGGVLKSATKRPLSVPSKTLFNWRAAADAMATASILSHIEPVVSVGDEKVISESTNEDEIIAEGINPAVCLFIAHDNPQLSKTVTSRLVASSTPPPPATSPKDAAAPISNTGMQIMLESKGQGDQTHFLLGDIIYSGDYAHVQDTATSNVRGSEWLIVTNLRAVKHAVKQFKTRDSDTNKEVVEINLVDVPESSVADVSNAAGVVEFLSACQARVDCILDPYHSDNTWYPYFEGTAGGGAQRKMAPQFRSQGIGYIRLGDDMSNFGVAFVSLDAGATYLDNGATSIVDSSLAAKTKFVATPNSKAIRGKALLSRKSLSTEVEDFLAVGTGAATPSAALAGNRKSMGGVKRATTGTSKQSSMEKVSDLLSSLQDATIKFSQRTEFLNSLQALLSDIYMKTSRADILEAFVLKNLEGLGEVLRVLLEYLTKQKHPLVVAATLQCIGTLTYGELLAAHFAVSWRALVVETAHMLRNNNKQIFEAVVGALGSLYRSRALSFAYLSGGGGGVLLDILNGPRSSGGVSSSSSAALVVNGGSNIAKVVTWLDTVAKGDLEAAVRLCAVQSRVTSTDEGVNMQRRVECVSCQANLAEALRRVSFLLSHREEVTREHGIALVVSYLTLFVLFGHFSHEEFTQLTGQVLDAKVIASDSTEMLAVLEALEKASARSFEKVLTCVTQAVGKVAGELSVILAEAPVVTVVASVSAPESVTSTVGETDVQSGVENAESCSSSSDEQVPVVEVDEEQQQQVPTTPIVDVESFVTPLVDFQSPEQDGAGVAPLKIEF